MCKIGAGHAAAVLSLAACFCAASAPGAGNAYPRSADEAIAGALANVKSRYRAKLAHYGLTESYFDETGGICDLMLLDVTNWTKYQIVFYRATDQIEYPRMMPVAVAKDLMSDRMIIHKYESALCIKKKDATDDSLRGKAKANAKKSSPKTINPPSLDGEYVPTAEEKAAMASVDAHSAQLKKEQESDKKKTSLAQTSDFRQMKELLSNGMRGDAIASRFGMERVRQFNAAYPNIQIRTSTHSKPGAPGFVW